MNIREERKAARLSPSQLARLVGVSITTARRWETPGYRVNPEHAERLAAIFAAAKVGTVDPNSTAFRVPNPRKWTRREFTNAEVARAADVSIATVDHYNTGRHPVSPKTCLKIKRAIAKLRRIEAMQADTPPDLPPLAIPEPPRPMPPPTVLPANVPNPYQRAAAFLRRVFGKS